MRPKWEPTTDMLTKSAWGEGGLLEEEKKRKMKAAATGFYPSGFVNESCPPSLIKRLGHLGYPCLISNPVLVFRGCLPLYAFIILSLFSQKMQWCWYIMLKNEFREGLLKGIFNCNDIPICFL